MPFLTEKEMYGVVCGWLTEFLKQKHRRAEIRVFDSSQTSLARLISDKGLSANLPPEWLSWDIYVDVVGFIITPKATSLAFVECKKTSLTLGHLSQLIGYSRVVLPLHSFLVSPRGASASLVSLLKTHRRIDVLEYQWFKDGTSRAITVAKWAEPTKRIDLGTTISTDRNTLGRIR